MPTEKEVSQLARIVSWNIKQFSLATWNSPTRQNIILQVFGIADLVLILEGPASGITAGALVDSVVQDLGVKWEGDYILNPALGNESDSTLVFWNKNKLKVTDVERLALPSNARWDNSVRRPAEVSITVSRKNYSIGVWHAPSPGNLANLIASSWAVLKDIPGLDLFVGDFNVDVSINRSPYDVKGPDHSTVFSNPNLYNISDWTDFFTSSSKYDKVIVAKNLPVAKHNAIRDSIKVVTTPLKPFTFKDIYSVSDHCPITCVI